MLLLPLLLLIPQDVVVTGPAPPNTLTPATMVIEPAAMLVIGCDADGDGATTRSELEQCLDRIFPVAGMRFIDYGDWALKWLGNRAALPAPEEIDRDGDGTVSRAELQRQFSRLFSRFDRVKDSQVTRAEALTIRAIAADDKGPKAGLPPRRGERRRGQ